MNVVHMTGNGHMVSGALDMTAMTLVLSIRLQYLHQLGYTHVELSLSIRMLLLAVTKDISHHIIMLIKQSLPCLIQTAVMTRRTSSFRALTAALTSSSQDCHAHSSSS